MKIEQIIELARKSGLRWYPSPEGGDATLELFASLIASYEREECAKICDSIAIETNPDDFALDALYAASGTIRARSL